MAAGETGTGVTQTIIVGLGNPVLSDDAVGVHVARALRPILRDRPDVAVTELHVGGMALMEALVGFDRAIVVDCMEAGGQPGTIYHTGPDRLGHMRNSACAHNTTLAAALEIGRHLQLPLPRGIEIWGVEPLDVATFSEELTDEVGKAVPVVVKGILQDLPSPPIDGEHRESRRLLL